MTPMPLSAALQKHFPDGGVTLSTMQNAIRQGKLNCSRLGRVYMVTAEDFVVAPPIEGEYVPTRVGE